MHAWWSSYYRGWCAVSQGMLCRIVTLCTHAELTNAVVPRTSRNQLETETYVSYMQMSNYNRNNQNLYGNSNHSNGGGFNSKARGEQFRNRAIDGISKLNETDDLMADSMRLVNNSKELGVSTLVKVDEQTEILINTKQNVD